MKLLNLFIITIVLTTISFAQKPVSKWKISDYLNNLPSKYKKLGNYAGATKETTIIDNKNGYASYQVDPDDEYSKNLEMALFKANKGLPTIVITNVEDDHVCGNNYAYFLQKNGENWVNVKEKVLPKLDFSMIFIDGKNDDSYKYYKKMQKKYGGMISNLEYKFHPPRKGTKMKVSLNMCDWVDDTVANNKDLKEYSMILDSVKPIYLQWNKAQVKFEIVKE